MGSLRFTDTLQIGIDVHGVEPTMRRYVDDCGVGPSECHELHSHSVDEFREDAEPVECAWRLATTMVGHVPWELIQPRGDRGGSARFLAGQGEGVQHVPVVVSSFDEEVTARVEACEDLARSSGGKDARIVDRPTEQVLSVFLEIFGRRSNSRCV